MNLRKTFLALALLMTLGAVTASAPLAEAAIRLGVGLRGPTRPLLSPVHVDLRKERLYA